MKVFSFVIHCVVKFPFFIENEYIATTETKAKRKILNSKIWIKRWWNDIQMKI